MTIKEVEEQLGLPRATIRFYEKEKLLVPQRGGNTYREYSEDDIAVLKKIIILRKLGFSVSEIKDFLEENVPLQELLEKNILELQEKMNELNGAIKICKKMQSRQEDFDSFNETYYWEEIRAQEQAGNKFLEVVNDTIKLEKDFILKHVLNIVDDKGKVLTDKKEIIFKIICTFVIYALVHFTAEGLRGQWEIKYLFEGLLLPLWLIILYTIFGLPWHFFKKKCPELAREYGVVGYGVVVGTLTISILLFLGLFLGSIFFE